MPVGWFDTDAWYYHKDTVRLSGPALAEMIAGQSVMDKAVWIYSDNAKVRVFAYTNTDESVLKVVVLNKEKSDRLNLNISLPRQYNAVNAMVLHGTRNPSTNSAAEDSAPVYESHLDGNHALDSLSFSDSITYGECAVIYTFFNDNTSSLGSFDFTSVESNALVGTSHTFKWGMSDNATNYHLVISENSTLESPEIDVYTAGKTHFQPSTDLRSGTDYYCKVTALNSAGTIDNISGVMHFRTCPDRILVNDTITDNTKDAYWEYSGNWRHQAYLGCLYGDDHVSRTAGSSATLHFNGAQARIYGVKGDWCGKADVFIDGTLYTTLDFYRKNPVAQPTALPTQDMLFDTGFLGHGQHSITITVRSDKNDAISGEAYIELDYAQIYASADEVIQYHAAAPVLDLDLPETVRLFEGNNHSLCVECAGTGNYSYEWYHDDRLIAVTAENVYFLTNVTQQDGGSYYVRITNESNGITKTVKSSACYVEISEASPLESFLQEAYDRGFCYTYQDEATIFDGTRIENGTTEDMLRLKTSNEGTLLVRYKTNSPGSQVIFAAGNNHNTNGYGAILVNNVPNVRKQRIDFPNGMFANLRGTTNNGEWHTFLYSVDATSLPDTTAKTVTSFDGNSDTQFPNYASWYNANPIINNIQFIQIGGVNGVLANSGNNTGFNGEIAFVAFVPRFVSQEEAALLTAQ